MTDAQQPATRIGYAERDAAVEELQQHHAEGRLTAEEFYQRMETALQARTKADLEPLFADLPSRSSNEAPEHRVLEADASPGTTLERSASSWSSATTWSASWTSPTSLGSQTVHERRSESSGSLELGPGEPHWLSALRIASWAAVPMGFVFVFMFGSFRWMLVAMILAPVLAGITGSISKRRDDERRRQAELDQRKDWR